MERAGGLTSSWGWILGLYTIASFIEVVFWGQIMAFTPLFLPHLGIRHADVRSWVGIITAVSSLLGVPFLPFWGALADRYARKPVIVRSFLVYLMVALLMALAGNVWLFLLARAALGLSLGNTGLMLTTLAERIPDGRLGFAYGIMNGSQPLGVFLGPLIGGPILDAWGFRALIGMDAVLLLLVVAALVTGYRDTYRTPVREPLLRMALGSVGILLRSPRLRTLFPALFLLFAGWMLASTYLPLAVTSLYRGQHPGTAVGLVLGAAGLTTAIMTPLAGLVADRIGHWRALMAVSGLAAALWPLPALAGDLIPFTVLWALVSGVMSSVFSVSFNVLAASAPEHVRARVMSFSFLPIMTGSAVGPAIGVGITHASPSAIFPAAAISTAAGLLALLAARRQPLPETLAAVSP
jgi:DHA1 family multidrug resistance protein-like MFS transporter